jgi:hypothetical protein
MGYDASLGMSFSELFSPCYTPASAKSDGKDSDQTEG